MAKGSPSLHHARSPGFPLLSLLTVALVSCSVHCVEDKKLVTIQKLRWGDLSRPPSSNTGKEMSTSSVVLEMKQQLSPQKLLTSDEARVTSLQLRIKAAATYGRKPELHSSTAQIPLSSGLALHTLNYIITIEVGGRRNTVILDTGSDLTWVQCAPCANCYIQKDPFFDPSASPTYTPIPCNSTSCTSLKPATGAPGTCGSDRSTCRYALSYGDGSYTRGVLARDRVGLGGTEIEGFVFGCGRSNHGLFGGTSGLVGLGRTQLSLISQTRAQFGGIFSYCLPSKVYNSTGNLVLGGDESYYRNVTPISYTRLISDPTQAPFYFLNLTGMRIGGVAVEAPGFAKGKILIDSGTVVSRLVPSVYQALRAEFLRQFSGYPRAAGFSILDTCFDLSGYDEVRVPTVRLGFEEGVEMNVDVSGIFFFARKDASQVCLAVASLPDEEETGIIGNYQQKNQRVVYDTVGNRLGFGEESCSYA